MMKRSRSARGHSTDQDDIPKLSSLDAPVSPPSKRGDKRPRHHVSVQQHSTKSPPSTSPPKHQDLAAIEAGEAEVTDHLSIIASRLMQCARQSGEGVPRLDGPNWVSLYQRNQHADGRHFVVHQHDHPIAGPHYDLRLQFSDSSSVSWSVMYGLPGDPNSRRLNRNATETRVHCLWNHLIETASVRTGSMIIWDTGEYEILPYDGQPVLPETDDSRSDISSEASVAIDERSDSEKLRQSFHNRKIRLRLHGARLPPNYTIILRLDKSSDYKRPTHPTRRRRRKVISSKSARPPSTSSSGSSTPPPSTHSTSTPNTRPADAVGDASDTPQAGHSDAENDVDHQIRLNNAYPGSTNSIGSIHQRRWFITLDRVNSGFTNVPGPGPAGKRWVRRRNHESGILMGFDPFYVRGPEAERSIVTGRLGKDVLEDEGVDGFVPRRGWRAVLE